MKKHTRRLSPRFQMTFPSYLEDKKGNVEQCKTRNISNEGVFIECGRFFLPGTQLKAVFTSASGDPEIKADATVIRALEIRPSSVDEFRLHFGIGLQFESFTYAV